MNPKRNLHALRSLNPRQDYDAGEAADLERLLAEEPHLSGQAEDLARFSWKLREMVDAATPIAAAGPVPEKTLHKLRSAREELKATSPAQASHNRVPAPLVPLGALPSPAPRKNRPPVPALPNRRSPYLVILAKAAALTLLALPLAWWLHQEFPAPVGATATASPALAPRGITGMTQPALVWENQPGQDYTVWILPGGSDQKTAPALFVAENVQSPVSFNQLRPGPANVSQTEELEPGTPYLALVCLAGQGRLAGVAVPFETAPGALGPPPAPTSLETAVALAQQMKNNGRLGDAIMILSSLPDELRHQPQITALEAQLRKAHAGLKDQ